jgi:diguanylate cyclase (GGDEF)-like protein
VTGFGRRHQLGVLGLAVNLLVMASATSVTGSWSTGAACTLVAGAVGAAILTAAGHRFAHVSWTLLLWPVSSCVTVAVLHRFAPEATALLSGVIVVSFLYVGVTMRPLTSVLLVVPAAFVLILTADLPADQAMVRVPLAAGIWIAVAEIPARLLADLRRKETALMRQASTDSLTGVLNRSDLDRRLATLGPGDAVVLIDVDHFKQFNDDHGHVMGDDALMAFAEVLRRDTRQDDVVFRYGGEEFLVVCPGTTVERAGELTERISATWAANSFGLTFSAGVAPAGPGAIARADTLLYEAKRAGRARVVTASATT